MVSALLRLLLTACLAFGLGAAPLVEALATTHAESAVEFDEVRPETVAVSSQRLATQRHDAVASARAAVTPAAFENTTTAFAVLALPRSLTHGRPPSQAPPLA